MPNLIGQSLGRYHILEQLGEGGMAVVYKAYDMRLERNVAIKVILPQKQHTEKFIKRFEREAKALAQLGHPNIVKVIEYGEHEGLPYLVMEYLPGGTLKHKLAGRAIPWQDAIKILIPIARALSYAHGHKIIHRDVKPSNILITDSGEPMLSDFGIAKILEAEETLDLTGTGVGVGTPEYMSPEQAQGGEVDARSDVYSLGVVLYEMVTGRRPYQADTPMAVAWKLASEPLPRPRQFVGDLPDAVEGVLFKALAKNPEDRYIDMGTFETVLGGLDSAQWKAGKAPRVQKILVPMAPARPGEKQTGQKWMPIVITTLVLLAVIAAGASFFQRGQKGAESLVGLVTATGLPLEKTVTLTSIPPTLTAIVMIPTPVIEQTHCESFQEKSADIFSVEQDGESINFCSNADWESCRDFYGMTWDSNENATVGATYQLTGKYVIQRTILFFDTSQLFSCGKINKVTLNIHVGPFINNDTHFRVFPIQKGMDTFPILSRTSIQWNPLGSGYADSSFKWISINLTGNDFNWVNVNGMTAIALVHEFDFSGILPTTNNDLTINMFESTNKPFLTIFYSNP